MVLILSLSLPPFSVVYGLSVSPIALVSFAGDDEYTPCCEFRPNITSNYSSFVLAVLIIIFLQLFFSYFKDLVGREVTVELKNDLAIRGTLHSVDQYLNIKLENTRVVDQDKYPHMLSVRNCFIRGSVVRYVQLPPDGVDVDLLHDATRREARGG
ncbi:unnamed protein product [Linum tenue]|uniref:Sm domain-containing protein n=1 Tax=Linum tenue TaxID=586396 RepID=A0AAV0ICW4_9ROSI|nr:unnamed protein product [Linum tenue]